MGSAGLLTQINVYFKKLVRIAFREKCWKSVIFSVIIAFAAAAVCGEDMFSYYSNTKSGFFTVASACIWVGIFNSIQSICKEHEIIHADYQSGMKISAFVISQVLWQAILCIVQTVVMYLICVIFIDFNTDGVMLPHAAAEYIITMYLLVFGSSTLGIMISSLSAVPTTAMTIMPFVLIVQLIMSGVLFELTGASNTVSYITFSKWGMSAFGSISDLNNIPLKPPALVPPPVEDCYTSDAATLLTAWAWCIGISLACILISMIILKLKNKFNK